MFWLCYCLKKIIFIQFSKQKTKKKQFWIEWLYARITLIMIHIIDVFTIFCDMLKDDALIIKSQFINISLPFDFVIEYSFLCSGSNVISTLACWYFYAILRGNWFELIFLLKSVLRCLPHVKQSTWKDMLRHFNLIYYMLRLVCALFIYAIFQGILYALILWKCNTCTCTF